MRKPFLAHSANISTSISKPRAARSRRRIASPLSPYNQVQASLTHQSKKAAEQPRQKNAPDYDLLSQRFGFNDVFEP